MSLFKHVAKFVSFGRGGDIVYYDGSSRCSGYGTPEKPHAAVDIPDGVIALDKRPALETPEGVSWVFKGPMVNPDIPDGEYDPCPEPSELFTSAVAGNSFGSLLTIHAASKGTRGSLDHVSVAEYVDGWRKLGARVGVYSGGSIIWEEG